MSDFTMCANSRCPSSALCERFTATPSPQQSYCSFKGYGKVGIDWDQCAAYVPNEQALTFSILSTN